MQQLAASHQAAHRPGRPEERHRPAARRQPDRDHPAHRRHDSGQDQPDHRGVRGGRSGSSPRSACWSSASWPTRPTTARASPRPAQIIDNAAHGGASTSWPRKACPRPPPGRVHREGRRHEAKVRYEWVELGKQERQSLGLSNANETAAKNGLWQRARLAAQQDRAAPAQRGRERRQTGQHALLQPAQRQRTRQLANEQAEKARLDEGREGGRVRPQEGRVLRPHPRLAARQPQGRRAT